MPAFMLGLLYPLGFAPFHLPGLSLFSLGMLYLLLSGRTVQQTFKTGLYFGLGAFGFGVSWVYVSIHAYGHLHPLLSAGITLLFILYLSLYTGCFTYLYHYLIHRLGLDDNRTISFILRSMTFSTVWILVEVARSHFLTGFPWLLLGVGQFDSPLKIYLPMVGVYGTGFIACFFACILAHGMSALTHRRHLWMTAGIIGFCCPLTLAPIHWTQASDQPLKVAIVQANLSMRDKWDESLFWSILNNYHARIQQLLDQDLIVLPESAIPLPASYVQDILNQLHQETQMHQSSLVFGIPREQSSASSSNATSPHYFNSMQALGLGSGQYLKQHLVPFGEYIPHVFQFITQALGLPDPHYETGHQGQPLIQINHRPIASLICYELAYAELLRAQLPLAQWIISISDDGWFGHSFATPQQNQMAQVRSLQTGRFQMVANNDGYSSVLNDQGEAIASLPGFKADVLKTKLIPMTGSTPWVRIGDLAILKGILALWAMSLGLACVRLKRRNAELSATLSR
jgi:apolipoprotein N-acyltransferase